MALLAKEKIEVRSGTYPGAECVKRQMFCSIEVMQT